MSQLAVIVLVALGGTVAIMAYTKMKHFEDLHSAHIITEPTRAVPQDIAMPQAQPRIPIIDLRPVIVPEPPMQSYPQNTRTVPIFTIMPIRNRYGF